MQFESYKTDEEKAVEKIQAMLVLLNKAGFSRQESYSLLGLAVQLSRERRG